MTNYGNVSIKKYVPLQIFDSKGGGAEFLNISDNFAMYNVAKTVNFQVIEDM